MKKSKQKNNLVNDLIIDLIVKVKDKYNEYQFILDKKFYNDLEKKLTVLYNQNASINQRVELLLIANNLVLKRLADEIGLGNVDIEISLIEKYENIVNMIIRKMGFDEGVINEYREKILIDTLESYDGNKLFSLAIVDYIRKNISNEKSATIKEQLDEYVKNNKSRRKPTYIEKISKKLDILSGVDDENLSKFIYLKYGYYNDVYFSCEEISSITSQKMEDINCYYKESLILLKSVVNKYIGGLVKEEFCKIKVK